MKILSYILISLFLILVIGYCTITNSLKKTTWGGWTPPPDTELTEEENESNFQSEDKKLSPKDAIEKLKSTKSFADDIRLNPTNFSIKINHLIPDTSGYYYINTIYSDKKKNEQIISNYRVSSKSGNVAKQILKTNKWVELR